MGNFLVVISSDDLRDEAIRHFRSGLEVAHRLKFQDPSAVLEKDWVCAASFVRQNGSGTSIVTDPKTGSWLLAVGTWFHARGYGSGAESRLLDRYLEVSPVQLGRELEGFFVIIVGDARVRETVVLTDIVGSCHAFIRLWRGTVALSGSSLVLACLGDFTVDSVGFQEFLFTGVMYEDRTLYREVRKLGPSTIFRFADGTMKNLQKYWHVTDLVPESLEGPSAVEALGEVLINAAKTVSRLFPRPVCDLTGGYDSRALVAAFLTAGETFSTTVTGPAQSADVIVARSVARIAGLPHLHLVPQTQRSFDQIKRAFLLTDGEYDLIEYARISDVHLALSKLFDISINGSFGEVARGWFWEGLWPQTSVPCKLDAEKLALLQLAAQGYGGSLQLPWRERTPFSKHCDEHLIPPEARLDLISHFAAVIERTISGLSHLPITLQMDYIYLMVRMQCWQGRIASSTNRLWPCLSPFIFRSVLETMLQTTARIRRRGLLIRSMLAEMQPKLAEFPLEYGYPAIPVTWKSFYRFWPVPVHYGKEILSKVARVHKERRGPLASEHLNARLMLWNEEEVRNLMDPAGMRISQLVDDAILSDFLKRSQQLNFPFGDQWARVLSLEYTLHVLNSMRISRIA